MAGTSEMLVVPVEKHNEVIRAIYLKRGFDEDEASKAAQMAAMATRHGVRTHNGLKGLHLDDTLGSQTSPQGCVPGAKIEKSPGKYKAFERWNCNRKLGQAVALEAMETAMRLADEYGVGCVVVDNAFHYLWGGGYVMDAASKGYVAYTNCPAARAEVIPFMGKSPTIGTNPHSWGFPTKEAIGYPIVIDWATSVVAMGRVAQLAREGKELPPGAAVDAEGKGTTDPKQVAALVPFGAHKGYGLALIDEIVAALSGGSLPTIRTRFAEKPADGEKQTCTFFFQAMKADAFAEDGCFAQGRSQSENIKAVIDDILSRGNEKCTLPGQIEAEAAKRCEEHGGLLFSRKEVEELADYASKWGVEGFDAESFKVVSVPE